MNERIEQIKENINKRFPKEKKITLFVVIGLIGILLIFLSELFESEPKDKSYELPLSLKTTEYKKEIENELTEILSQIQGVGNVKVMITIEGTSEYVFAQEINTQQDKQSDSSSESFQNKYVIIDNGSKKEALVEKVLKPKINGVIVVCEGGDSLVVKEKVYKAVSTVLAISSTRVCVVRG